MKLEKCLKYFSYCPPRKENKDNVKYLNFPILESETLSRKFRVTESAQEIVG